MPAAVFPIVLVRLYDRDTTVSIQVIVSTSLAGLVLIPAWLLLAQNALCRVARTAFWPRGLHDMSGGVGNCQFVDMG